MAAIGKALLPLITTGIGAAVNRINERQRQRYGNANGRNTNSSRSRTMQPARPSMRNTINNSRNRRGRDIAVSSRSSAAPVAQGVTSRTLPTQSVDQRATEQFETVAAPNNKFTPYYKTTMLMDELAFPRLSQICGQFQKFDPRGLCYEYTPATATSQPGTIYMGFDPDITSSLPTSSEQMRGLVGAVSGPVWKTLRMPIPKALMSKVSSQMYIRRPISASDNLNNVGKFIYAVEGVTTTAIVGYLQIAYDISLIQPKTVIGANTTCSLVGFDLAGGFAADPTSPILNTGDGVFVRQTRAPILITIYHPNATLPVFTMDDGSTVKTKAVGTNLDLILLPFGTSGGSFTDPDAPVAYCVAHALSPQEHALPAFIDL